MSLPNIINIVLWSGYLDVADRSSYSMTCREAAKLLITTESISEGISHCPLPSSCRFNFWRWCLSRQLDFSIFEGLHGGDIVGYYLHHRALLTPSTTKKSSGQLGEIMRDVGRTFPEHPFFNSRRNQPGEAILARILCATLSSTPNIGYCQGMNFVVGILILARVSPEMIEKSSEECKDCDMESNVEENVNALPCASDMSQYDDIEADVFWMFQYLLIKNDLGLEMEFIWKPGFPKMKLKVFQFDRLLELYLPALHNHFESINLSPEVVVSQWFMTLFTNTLPLPFIMHMWDYIFVGSWPAIYRAALGILCVLHDRLLEMDLEEVGLLTRDWKRGKFDIPVSFRELLNTAETFSVTHDTLLLLQENYALDIIAAALGDRLDSTSSVGKSYHGGCMGLAKPGADSWLQRHGDFPPEMREVMFEIHNELNEMSSQVDRDKTVLQKKILRACEACEVAYEALDKAIAEEMQWLHYTTNLKQDLSTWEKRAETALAELKWQNENEKYMPQSRSSYVEEDDSYDSDSDSDYSGSSSSDSGEYVDEDDEYGSESSDECSDYSSSEYSSSQEAMQRETGGSYFYDAVSNMTSLLIPTTQSTSTPGQDVKNSGQIRNVNSVEMKLDSTMPQISERDENESLRQSPAVNSNSSSPESNKLPVSDSADSLAQKIKANPSRRRTSSVPGLKQQTESTAPRGVIDVDDKSNRDLGDSINVENNSPQLVDASSEKNIESVGTKNDSPKSPSRFQNFKSGFLRRSNSSEGNVGNANKGGGRVGFSRRYISSKLEKRKVKIEKARECHFLHKQIIKSTKEVDIAKKKLSSAREHKQFALIADEEAKEWKDSLCEQFQLLVKDAERCRSQKLIYLVDTYGM